MPSDWIDYAKLSVLTARLRNVGSETADQAAEAIGALWRHIEEQDQLRAALPTEKALSDMQFAMEEYKEITDRLQQCVQRHRLGLGGERIDVLVCDEVDRLRAAHQERDADARRLDWLEGWMQDGCFQMDMMDLCYGSDSVRAAIDAAMAPGTQTHD